MSRTSRLPGLRDRSVEDRREMVADGAELDRQVLAALDPAHGLSVSLVDHMIENAIGVFGVPLGVATNFVVNGVEVLVPMATEEASVAAAARSSPPSAWLRTSLRSGR